MIFNYDVSGAISDIAPKEITIYAPSDTTLTAGTSVAGHVACNGVITLSTTAVSLSSGGGTGWKAIGTIPAGYRPSEAKFGLAFSYTGSGVTNTYAARITTAGTIQIMALPNDTTIYFSLTYQI